MPDVVALSDSFVPSLPKGWNAAVRIKLADGTTDATVYKDANGDATGANPLPLASAEFGRNYDGNGGWQCYLVPGDYVVSVTPHGGSEHHASVTVTAAAAGVTRALYEVYGTPSADVPVPTWNPDSGRLEFAAGGGGGGGASEPSWLQIGSDAQGPVSVPDNGSAAAFVGQLIGSTSDAVYSSSAGGSDLPAGWALVDDGSGNLRNITAPVGIYLVRLLAAWGGGSAAGTRVITGRGDIHAWAASAEDLAQYTNYVATVAVDGHNMFAHDLDGALTFKATQNGDTGVQVTFAELDIYKIG